MILFQAILTSELAIDRTPLPFTNMKELYESDYTFYVYKDGGRIENAFQNPIPGKINKLKENLN